MTLLEYLNLIPSQNRTKTKFIAMATAGLEPLTRLQTTLLSLIPKFDVDIAVGDQLDIIGRWVGISRRVDIPATGIYFSWDATYDTGWDFGIWEGPNNPSTITELPDDSYRTLIKAKIAANQWDGTTTGAYAIWDAVFTELEIFIQDNQDMSYDLIFYGGIIDQLTLALLTGGYLPLKPEGVKVNTFFIPIDGEPVFGWDMDTYFMQGWDEGSWAREVTP